MTLQLQRHDHAMKGLLFVGRSDRKDGNDGRKGSGEQEKKKKLPDCLYDNAKGSIFSLKKSEVLYPTGL